MSTELTRSEWDDQYSKAEQTIRHNGLEHCSRDLARKVTTRLLGERPLPEKPQSIKTGNTRTGVSFMHVDSDGDVFFADRADSMSGTQYIAYGNIPQAIKFLNDAQTWMKETKNG